MPDKNWQFELEEYIKQGEPLYIDMDIPLYCTGSRHQSNSQRNGRRQKILFLSAGIRYSPTHPVT